MPQSLSQLYVHITFHIKTTSVEIRESEEPELYAYIASIIKDLESLPIIIGGCGNHIHILCAMSKNIALAKLVEEIKRHSSRWIKTKSEYYTSFAWQGGYAGFSVSPSVLGKTKTYIKNQKAHHAKSSFHDEYLAFLKEYGIDYDENYCFSD